MQQWLNDLSNPEMHETSIQCTENIRIKMIGIKLTIASPLHTLFTNRNYLMIYCKGAIFTGFVYISKTKCTKHWAPINLLSYPFTCASIDIFYLYYMYIYFPTILWNVLWKLVLHVARHHFSMYTNFVRFHLGVA